VLHLFRVTFLNLGCVTTAVSIKLSVPRKVFQQYSGREQVQSYVKDYRNEMRDELTGSSTFACHWKRYRELVWNENFRLLSWLQCAYSLNIKQRSTKHTHKTKDRVTRTPLKTGGELMCCVYSLSKSTKEVYYVPLVVNNYRSFPQS
jgi:hypothetical protein